MTSEIKEGFMPFKGYKTYYRIVEGKDGSKVPLLLLHGGPGSTHNTLEVLDDIAAKTGRTLVYYDQIGCGLSSIPDDHPELYSKETWCQELEELRHYLNLTEIHLLGHSWGGMLAITYLSDCNPKGLKSVVLSSTLPSVSLWAREAHRLIKDTLPLEDQEAIAKAEQSQDWADPAYQKANELFVRKHIGGPWGPNDPACLTRPKTLGKKAYEVAWGPNEYNPLGNLSDWEYLEKMRKWNLPVLMTDGANDESTPYINQQMFNAVKGAEWHIFEFSRHMSYVEEHEEYVKVVTEFLAKND